MEAISYTIEEKWEIKIVSTYLGWEALKLAGDSASETILRLKS